MSKITTDDPHDATATTRIRTPDRRLRVFISSTLGELADERQAARAAVEQLRLTPIMFELGARPHPPRALYRSYLAQSDVFVGIYWQRYGWVAPDMAISGLEDEFLLSKGMPRLVYVKRPAPEMEPRLAEMLGRLEGEDSVSYKPFDDVTDLRDLLLDDLAVLLTERFDAMPAMTVAERTASNLPASTVDVSRTRCRAGRAGRIARRRTSAARHACRSRRDGQDTIGDRSRPSASRSIRRRSVLRRSERRTRARRSVRGHRTNPRHEWSDRGVTARRSAARPA